MATAQVAHPTPALGDSIKKSVAKSAQNVTSHVVNHSRTKKKAIEDLGLPKGFRRTYFFEPQRSIAVVYVREEDDQVIRYGAAIARKGESFKKASFALTAAKRLLKKPVVLDGALPISLRKNEHRDDKFLRRQEAHQGKYLDRFKAIFQPTTTDKKERKVRHEELRTYLRTAIHRLGVASSD